MVEATAVGEAPVAAPTPGPEATGQGAPATPAAPDNQTPATPATPSEQAPSRTPKYRFKSQDEAERAHSELQSRYSKLGDPDQAAQRLALLHGLQNDPAFRDWAKARLAEQEAGSADPETQKALQIVETVAERKAREMVAPYVAQSEAINRASVYQAMTAKYPEWREYEPAMVEAFKAGVQSGFLSPQARLTVPLLETLYHAATGSDPEYAAKAYAKTLAKKQASATQATPGLPAAAVSTGPIRSIDEAFAAAKREHGMA